MSHTGQENQGTGLRDILDILVKAPPERLLSLTFQLGESPEDSIIHALCLIILQKEARALNKLQMLKDNCLANHLAEKWQMSGGKLEDFSLHCGHFQECTRQSLTPLARIFKVLSEQRLCDSHLRNLAYKRALSSDNQKTSNCEDLEYDQLREEAKVVCGPQFAEWMCSLKLLKSGCYDNPHSSLHEGIKTLKVTLSQDQTERAHSLPSPLQATSSMPSYPTHLEISMPPTASFRENKITQETSHESKLNTPVPLVAECVEKNALGQSLTSQPQPKSSEPLFGAKKHQKMDEILAAKGRELDSLITKTQTLHQTTKPPTKPNFALPTATNTNLPKMPVPNYMLERKDADEEGEAIFYSFVILHAPEDEDMAESIKERVETVIGRKEGATFSGDFAVPGKSTLRCVEDAINNSAFTLLLLTRNFNTRMQEMEADSALLNSINNTHKFNTVIPLLPRENCMPRESLPLVLQRINKLVEDRHFERKIKMFLSPAPIKKQRAIWTVEQSVKKQIERQERLKHLNQHQKQLLSECTAAQLLEQENLRLLMAPERAGGDGSVPWPPGANIHINNAQCIMIGNDSRMTVDLGGGADKDEDEQ